MTHSLCDSICKSNESMGKIEHSRHVKTP